MASQRLSKLDWIRAAFRALQAGGVAAVKVEPIAKALSVSKGSFYHHFQDQKDLYTQMIHHWEERATQDIIEEVEAAGGSAQERLDGLIAMVTSGLDTPYGGPGTEAAIRAWSHHDTKVAMAQARVDARREAYLVKLFQEAGQEKAASVVWARLFLSAYLGSAWMPNADRAAMLRHAVRLAI